MKQKLLLLLIFFGIANLGFAQYCNPYPNQYYLETFTNDSEDYIDRFQLETIDNTTGYGADTTGYSDYTTTHSTVLSPNETYTFTITRSTENSYSYGYAVWIDYNNDGDFDDAGEEIWSRSILLPQDAVVSGSFSLPSTGVVYETSTRMRVGLSYGAIPAPCANYYQFAEFEDYTIDLSETTLSISNLTTLESVKIYSNIQSKTLYIKGLLENKTSINVYDIRGREMLESQLNADELEQSVDVSNLNSGIYIVTLKDGIHRISKKIVIK
jgi:hypothetical protein